MASFIRGATLDSDFTHPGPDGLLILFTFSSTTWICRLGSAISGGEGKLFWLALPAYCLQFNVERVIQSSANIFSIGSRRYTLSCGSRLGDRVPKTGCCPLLLCSSAPLERVSGGGVLLRRLVAHECQIREEHMVQSCFFL